MEMEVKDQIKEKRDNALLNSPNQQTTKDADQDNQAENSIVEEQLVGSSEVEKNKVCLMRAVVENQDPSCKVVHVKPFMEIIIKHQLSLLSHHLC